MTERIPLWLDLRKVPVNKRLPYFKAAKNAGVERILLATGDPHLEREDLGSLRLDGNNLLKQGTTALGKLVVLRNAKDQQRAADAEGVVVVDAQDWTVIPFENLIAARRDRPGTLFALAHDPDEATLFGDTLETGVHGIVLAPAAPEMIEATDKRLRARGLPTAPDVDGPPGEFLIPARITRIEDAGPGDRVCVDATSVFRPGEGLLVGSTARSFVLVHAETIETEYVRARPFRVNAGAVHSYVHSADGRTHYLSELNAGSKVLAVHPDGVHRVLTVGRAKIERRPHNLVAWACKDGRAGSAVLQTAETIRLVRPDGTVVAVTSLKVGDTVLVHQESAARHFGMPVDAGLREV